MARGIAISDLHLFARRSVGADCFESVRAQLSEVDVMILNGDVFDFRWSTLSSVNATISASIEWLRAVTAAFPRCEVHYVLGNHDCPAFFRAALSDLSHTLSRLHVHELGLRMGSALFIHGDCTHRRMDTAGLRQYRKSWDNERRYGASRAKVYLAGDRLGLTWLTHKGWFPRRHTVDRLMYYLDRTCPTWRNATRDCYFGHTHLPFSDHFQDGVTFHNTGSGIGGMGFNPRIFSVPDGRVETLVVAEPAQAESHSSRLH
jgi:UDP-2,3-diacylglucosamine hydrolase